MSVCGGRCAETDSFQVDTVVGVGASAGFVGQPCAAERSATASRSKCGERVLDRSLANVERLICSS